MVLTNCFSKRFDYILAEWHLKKLCTNCRVYRKATVPFETNHRLLTMSCTFPSKRNRKLVFSRPNNFKPRKDISSLRNDPLVSNNFSNKLDELLADEPVIDDVNIFENFLLNLLFRLVNLNSLSFLNQPKNHHGLMKIFCP